MTWLRLFPLASTVVFPRMEVPLVVFEDRYRRLVAECLSEEAPFGIALIREGPEVGGPAVPHDVGTVVRLRSAVPAQSGRIEITAVGERRFRVVELHADRPYPSADVEYPVDELSPVPDELLARSAEGYGQVARLRQTMEGVYQRSIAAPSSPGALADAIAAAAAPVARPARLQSLLEELDVRRRLEAASTLLGDLVTVTHRRAQLVVAQRWGGVERRN